MCPWKRKATIFVTLCSHRLTKSSRSFGSESRTGFGPIMIRAIEGRPRPHGSVFATQNLVHASLVVDGRSAGRQENVDLGSRCRTAARTRAEHRRSGRGALAPLAGRGGGGASRAVRSGEPGLRRRRCPGSDPGGLLGLRDRPPHPEAGGVERPGLQGLRPSAPLQRVPAHPALELRHRHRPEPLPVPVPSRHQDRRLPDGAAAQGASPRPCEPVHRRRHRARQDHRGRTHCPRTAAAQEGRERWLSPPRRPCWSSGRPKWRSGSASCS